jgi:myo-inositol 2-dehydrogenase/D-chiro-inositol 1-dehydrogenase
LGRAHIVRIMTRLPDATVTVVNDVNETSARQTAEKGGFRVEANPHALIRSDDVDAVLVASWDRSHEEFVTSAIESKKPVFCEKPLCPDSQGCLNIMRAEEAVGKKFLTVGFMRRCDKGYMQMKAALDAGRIGAPLLVHAQHRNAAPTGERHTTEMSVNGALAHEFDVIRWLIGEPYVSVMFIAPKSTRKAERGLIDPQMVILRTESGIHIDLEIYMNCAYGYDIQCEAVGESGALRLPDPSNLICRSDGSSSHALCGGWAERFEEAYETELRDWIHCVKSGGHAGPDAWDGYAAAAVAEACIRSMEERETVAIDMEKKSALYR